MACPRERATPLGGVFFKQSASSKRLPISPDNAVDDTRCRCKDCLIGAALEVTSGTRDNLITGGAGPGRAPPSQDVSLTR
jgi:hypothetical protein